MAIAAQAPAFAVGKDFAPAVNVKAYKEYGREVFSELASAKCQCRCLGNMTQCSLTEEGVGG